MVAVEHVAALIEMIGGRPLAVLAPAVGSGDEIVVDEVLVVVGTRVTAYHAVATVVDDGIDHLRIAFHFWVSAVVVNPQTVADGPVAGAVGDGSEAPRVDALRDDAVLPSDIVSVFDVNIIPPSPRDGAMVENHVFGIVHGECLCVFSHVDGSSHTDIPEDDVLTVAYEHSVAIDGDALSRSSLSEHGDIVVFVNGYHL